MKFITSTSLVAALLLSGCASVEMAPKAESAKAKEFNAPGKGNAGIYIYRNSFVGKALKKDLWIDSTCIGESAPDTFFYKEVAGGKTYQLATESEFSPNILDVNLDSNKNHFFRQYIKMGMFVGGAGLETISDDQAKQDITKLEMAKAGKCTSKPPAGAATSAVTSPANMEMSKANNNASPAAETSVAVTQAVSSPSVSVTPMPNAANVTAATPAVAPTTTPTTTAPSTAMATLPSNNSTAPLSQANQIVSVTNVQTSPANTKIQLIEFALGVSSVTVERLAKEQSCSNTKGAGLVSPKGPHELYKMQCSDGRVLMAKCELRQCTVVSHK